MLVTQKNQTRNRRAQCGLVEESGTTNAIYTLRNKIE